MGKNYSVYSYVQVENPTIFPGCEVTGVVNILAEGAIDAMGLYLHFTGKEYTRWEESYTETVSNSDGSSRSETRTVVYTGSQTILTNFFLLHHFDGTLQKGQFSIPFRLKIPEVILPSFKYQGGVTAKRYYTIKAKLQGSKKLKATKSFVWISSLLKNFDFAIPSFGEAVMKVRNCCCCGDDRSIVNLSVVKNAYFFTERVDGTLRVDQTNCKKRLMRMQFSLYRKLRLRDNTGRSNIDYNRIVQEERYAVAGNIGGPIYTYDFSIELSRVQDLWQTPSTESGLIECIYEANVRLYYDTFCSGSVYQVSAPISISNSYEAVRTYFIPQPPPIPTVWNPISLASAPPEEHLNQI
jgi:hypothetical protein